jgi:hypothetical protein
MIPEENSLPEASPVPAEYFAQKLQPLITTFEQLATRMQNPTPPYRHSLSGRVYPTGIAYTAWIERVMAQPYSLPRVLLLESSMVAYLGEYSENLKWVAGQATSPRRLQSLGRFSTPLNYCRVKLPEALALGLILAMLVSIKKASLIENIQGQEDNSQVQVLLAFKEIFPLFMRTFMSGVIYSLLYSIMNTFLTSTLSEANQKRVFTCESVVAHAGVFFSLIGLLYGKPIMVIDKISNFEEILIIGCSNVVVVKACYSEVTWSLLRSCTDPLTKVMQAMMRRQERPLPSFNFSVAPRAPL